MNWRAFNEIKTYYRNVLKSKLSKKALLKEFEEKYTETYKLLANRDKNALEKILTSQCYVVR
jgi:hypothetical protein